MFLPPERKLLGIENRILVSASESSQIILWDIERERFEETIPLEILKSPKRVKALTFLERSNLLVSGTEDGELYFWDMVDPDVVNSEPKSIKKHEVEVTALTSSPEGTILVSGDANGIIHKMTEDEIHRFFE